MRQHGLFIGVDDYAFAPLTSSVNDAVAMRDAVVRAGILAAADCTLMTSPARPGSAAVPTRGAILDALLGLYDADPPLDRLIVLYAGHGLSARLARAPERFATVLVPAGVRQLRNSGGEMIDLDELFGRFRRRGAREQYWIIDACRNELEGPPPKVSEIGWDVPAPQDPREGLEMAQSALFAVAPLGQASARRHGHGELTSRLLEALAGRGEAEWGAGGWYDEAADAVLFDLDSLCDYARRRLRATLPTGSYLLDYVLPQCWVGERRPGPLLRRPVAERPFSVSIAPPAAAGQVTVALKALRTVVAAWPPRANGEAVPLVPELYRLDVRLKDGAAGWALPALPSPPMIDVRETGRLDLELGAAQPPAVAPAAEAPGLSVAPAVAQPTLSAAFVAPTLVPDQPTRGAREAAAAGRLRYVRTPEGAHYVLSPPVVTVEALDPGVSLHLVRLSGRREERPGKPNAPITLTPGIWRIEIRIGSDVIGVLEEEFDAGQKYTVSTTAQITPALAALFPDPLAEAMRSAEAPPPSLMPSESIGPMQGAMLGTLLPLLALKPLDTGNALLGGFSPRLGIPAVAQPGPAPLALALAFDGPWDDRDGDRRLASVAVDGGRPPLWRDPSGRIALWLRAAAPAGGVLTVRVPGWGAASVAVPTVDGFCTSVGLTVWPDGRHDASVSLFLLPPGADQVVRPGRLSRALALAARLYRGERTLDEVDYEVFSLISSGSYGDPVLGALAWFMRARRLAADDGLPAAQRADLLRRQSGIESYLRHRVPGLTDGRVIGALHGAARDAALDTILDDPATTQPVLADAVAALARRALATDRLEHWSVVRLQRLAPRAVFNVAVSGDRAEGR